ncbi:MAG: sulfur carrier protein ThiS [Victivallales bacterium]|nr:sulfur carrier protein ThiS [Victivallales bacterium]
MLTINGQDARDFVGKSLAEYLAMQGFEVTRLAVERNGEIVPKAQYAQTILQDGDAIEIVRFVGGG